MKHEQPTTPDFVRSIAETARILGVSDKTLRNMIDRGEGPRVTQISLGRIGIRDSHRTAWLETRARSEGAQAVG